MKLLQVIPFFSPIFGGSFISTCNLSKGLAKRGHDVTILTTDFKFDEQFAKSIENEHIKVVPVHCTANIGVFLFSPSMKNWLNYHIRDFDVIHMHNFRSYQNNLVHKYAMQYAIPYILQAHGSVMPFFEKIALKKCYDLAWGNKILRDASKVIALTQFERSQYMEMSVPEDKIRMVPNGIELDKYNELPIKGEFRTKFQIDAGEKIILYLGRIHRIKGIDLLIRAFADLVKSDNSLKLVIVGPDDGFLPSVLSDIDHLNIHKKVLLTGPLYGREKQMAFIDADVYVLPSVYETFPNTVLEAYACGTPVIVTDRCGIADIVREAGLVVGFDEIELKNGLSKLLTDAEFRIRCQKSGNDLIKNKYNYDEISSIYESLYRSLA